MSASIQPEVQGTDASYLLEREFSDVDDLAETARQWNVDFRPLERGRFFGEMLQFAAHGVHVSDARFHRSLNQKGTPPAGLRTIAIPADPNLSIKWRGKLVDGQSLMVFPRESELESVSGRDFHVYTCSFSEESLAGLAENLQVGRLDQICHGQDAIRIEWPAIDRIRGCLNRICRSVRQDHNRLNDGTIGSDLTYQLPALLIAAIATTTDSCPAISGPNRLAALGRAESFVEQHAHEDIRVGDICLAAKVSERTLQYAFMDQFGMGPKEFLNTFRLMSVRRELRNSHSRTTSVADIANAWGFWHMGQFAADYRKHFQELPSQTLRRPTDR